MRKLGNAIQNLIASWSITDPNGWVWGSPTGGAKGANTINVQGGIFLNGTAVSAGGTTLTSFTKAADTARASTTTPTNDPDLITGSLAAGTYVVEVWMLAVDAAAGGYKYTFNFTGTQTTPNNGTGLSDDINPIATFYRTNGASTQAVTLTAVGGTGDIIYATFVVVVTVAGVLSLQWSQVTSNPGNVTLKAGSTMRYQKVA